MKLLVFFVSRRGELITRKAIAECLWEEPQNIDVSNRINTAVNRLRATLHDDPASPKYLETVVGMGYRFVADVEETKEGSRSFDQKTEPDPNSGSHRQTEISASIIDPGLWSAGMRPPMDAPGPPAQQLSPTAPTEDRASDERLKKAQPPTRSSSRWLLSAAFALLVCAGAAVWTMRRNTPLKSPAVSAPRTWMTLHQTTFNDGDNRVTTEAVSHSGNAVAYSDDSGISVRVIETGMDRLLASPKGLRCNRVTCYPGDDNLLVSCADAEGNQEQVWTLPLNGGSPRVLLTDAAEAAISPDGTLLAFTRKHGMEVWTSSATGAAARRLTAATERGSFASLLWAWDGRRIIYNRKAIHEGSAGKDYDEDRWYTVDYESRDVSTGAILSTIKNVPFQSAVSLRDGRLLYPQGNLAFANPDARLMVVKTAVSTGEFLDAPHRVADIPADTATSLSISDDAGRVGMVLDRRSSNIFVGEVHFPGPILSTLRRLKHPAPENYPHAWTPAGDAVVFESNSTAAYSVFKQKLDGSAAELLARSQGDAVFPQVSPDGKWVLFENYTSQPSYHADAIFRVPLLGGKLEQVSTQGSIDSFQCSTSSAGRCVLREKVGKEFAYFELDPLGGQGKQLGRTARLDNFLGDWSLSPDGTTVASPFREPLRTGIRLTKLSQQSPLPTFDMPVKTTGSLIQVTWTPNSRGFYAESKSNEGYALLYIDQLGKATTLRKSGAIIWAVPSTNGKKIAFVDQSSNSNVWVGPGSSLR